jgi:hypothetical protein
MTPKVALMIKLVDEQASRLLDSTTTGASTFVDTKKTMDPQTGYSCQTQFHQCRDP